jgi:hypothetical protein
MCPNLRHNALMESTAPLNCDKAAQLTDLRQNVMAVIILVKASWMAASQLTDYA